ELPPYRRFDERDHRFIRFTRQPFDARVSLRVEIEIEEYFVCAGRVEANRGPALPGGGWLVRTQCGRVAAFALLIAASCGRACACLCCRCFHGVISFLGCGFTPGRPPP